MRSIMNGRRFLPAWGLILSLMPALTSAQTALDKVQSLDLVFALKPMKVYYSRGYEEVALPLASRYGRTDDYFRSAFGVNRTFSLAVLDSADWSKVSSLPYGLPFVSGPPFVVCMPATPDHQLGRLIDKALEADSGIPRDSIPQRVRRFTSFIGFHELGHIYAKELNLPTPNKWTYEFAATYLAYAYLATFYPSDNKEWLSTGIKMADSIHPVHTSLKDFEQFYVRVGVANYAWYQVIFLKMVDDVFGNYGTGFTDQWRQLSFPQETGQYHLEQMNELYSGFYTWAIKYKLINATH